MPSDPAPLWRSGVHNLMFGLQKTVTLSDGIEFNKDGHRLIRWLRGFRCRVCDEYGDDARVPLLQ